MFLVKQEKIEWNSKIFLIVQNKQTKKNLKNMFKKIYELQKYSVEIIF